MAVQNPTHIAKTGSIQCSLQLSYPRRPVAKENRIVPVSKNTYTAVVSSWLLLASSHFGHLQLEEKPWTTKKVSFSKGMRKPRFGTHNKHKVRKQRSGQASHKTKNKNEEE